MTVGMTTLVTLLTPLPDINQLAKLPEYLSAPITQLVQDRAEQKTLTAQEVMSYFSESKMALAYLKENTQIGVELLETIDRDGIEPDIDIRDVVECYESAAKIATSQLHLLKLSYILAESSPAWGPHVKLFQTHSQGALRVFANNRNILLRIATTLKQYLPVNTGEYTPKADAESYKELVNLSHKKLGIPLPVWG
ncbi:hypothetical protein V2H77_01125 [Photorhabdus sp. P32]|uniref:hypothetical protein n=1 Tax=Photorhabdus TaxID=29487 RepID=UPI00223CCF9C|nr:hypothetical protein [Photorhabdus aballayi]MCW7546506.1 hypothetical protein [Photorhabdus aballayi]